MSDNSRAYNSVWQLRGDSWCRLEEASRPAHHAATTNGELKEEYVAICRDLLATLTPLEPYWAYPGMPQFSRVSRLFAAGNYDKFAHAVAQINRALTTESYRSGDVEHAGLDEHDMFRSRSAPARAPASHQSASQPYFEVLVVESMTEEQERALRNEVRSWRRPDDEFVYELVVVSSGDEALIAARLNVNLQAVVIRRRFSHQSTRDLSTLSEFVDTKISDELADHKSPDERVEILATSLSKLRPELDLYLMTEIEVEDIAGRLGQHFRRVFHAREGVLELHLSILQGVAARYRTPFFSALKEYSHRPTGVFHALPISQGKSIVNSHWIKDMVGFYGLDVFMAETSATCGGLDSLLEPTGPLREAQQLAAEAYGSRHTLLRHQRHVDGKQDRHAVAGRPRRHRAARPQLPPVAPLRDDAGRRAGHLSRGLPAARLLDVRRGAAAGDQVKAVGAQAGRQAGPRQDDLADQLHVRRHRVRRQPRHGGMPGDQARPGVPVGRGVVRVRPLPPRVPQPHRDDGGANTCGTSCATRTTGVSSRRRWKPTRGRPPTDDELLNRRLIPGPGQGPGAGLRHPVDAQDADVAAAGLDDPRLRPGLRPEGRRAVPRGLHGAHVDVAELPDPGVAGPRPPAGRPGRRRAGAAPDRERHATARRDRQPSAAEQLHGMPAHVGPDPRGVPAVAHRPAAAVGPAQHDGRVGRGRVRARPVAHHAVDRHAPATTATPSSANS